MTVTLGEIMSSIIAVDENLLLKDVISLMRRKRIRRFVTASHRTEGSSKDVTEK